jgi:Icc-related predicted phosphoesterase
MKLLAVADLHGSQYRLNLVLDNVKTYTPDLVVVCGDITQFGPGELATSFLNQLPVKTLAIPGNIDTFDVEQGIQASSATDIHLKLVVINGVTFMGIGREMPSRLADIAIADGTTQKHLRDLLLPSSVLITHVPPYKIQDKMFLGSHGGSKELRSLVDTYKPRLVLCGHIHEDPGVTVSGTTTVVNCSLGKRTEGALVEITDTIDVTILE